MMSLEKVLKRERLCKAFTGLSPGEFANLVPMFEKSLEERKQNDYLTNPNRQRKPGGGKKSLIPTADQKLFFILFYFKCYPTFDLLGCFFNQSGRRECLERLYAPLTPVLEPTLGKKMVLRQFHWFIGGIHANLPRSKRGLYRRNRASNSKTKGQTQTKSQLFREKETAYPKERRDHQSETEDRRPYPDHGRQGT